MLRYLASTIYFVFPIIFGISYQSGSYIACYLTLCLFFIYVLVNVNGFLKILVVFFLFYMSIGLLNISSWRGYTDIEVISLYSFCFFSFFIFSATIPCKIPYKEIRQIYNQSFIQMVIFCHLSIVYLTLALVYLSIGPIIVNQSLRFLIPTELEYVIKSVLPVATLIPLLKLRFKLLLLIAVLLPAIFIGSRGTAVIAIVSYVISELFIRRDSLNFKAFVVKNKKNILFSLIAFFIISSGFYLRRGGNSDLVSASRLIEIYFDYDNLFVRLILPFYLGFKETIGISNIIITNDIVNNINPHSLFFADLFTVLPGARLAAGQTLGQIFGTTEGGGLTPGLLGGLYIDYGLAVVFIFMIFGFFFFILESKLRRNPIFIVVYAQVITQFIHLFHRGFLKPEYVTSIMIALFYYLLCHKIVFKK